MYSTIDRKTFNNEAMRSGTLLGILWIVTYALIPLSVTNPIIALSIMALNIISPIYAGYLTTTFRKKYCNNSLRYIQAWYFLLITYLCASILTAIAIFLYLQFVDSAALSDTINKMVETIKTTPEVYSALENEIEQIVAIYSNMSTRDIVLNTTTSNLMNGTLLAPIIAIFVKRNPQ